MAGLMSVGLTARLSRQAGAVLGRSLWSSLRAGPKPQLRAEVGRGLRTSAASLGGHARAFVMQSERLSNKRMSDLLHFYIVGLGFLPWALVALVQAVVWGRCRLEELPEGRVPRYWEYEDTPLKQLRAKYLIRNAVRLHEVQQGAYRWYDLKRQMSMRYQRMEHLIAQRQDYQAIFHKSSKAHWLDVSEFFKEEALHNYQGFHHQYMGDAGSNDATGMYYS